jgi:hypothetical protein
VPDRNQNEVAANIPEPFDARLAADLMKEESKNLP